MPDGERSRLFYIKHVKIGEFFSELKSRFLVAFGMSLFFGGITFIVQYGSKALGMDSAVAGTSAFDVWLKSIPFEVWFVIIFATVIWVQRGKSIKIDFPMLVFSEWILWLLLVCGMMAAYHYFPYWLIVVVWCSIPQLAMGYENLVRKGRENYEAEPADFAVID